MNVIYVVMGQTGEYSDHTDWSVAAYSDRAKADLHGDLAAEEAKRIFDAHTKGCGYWDIPEGANPYDPNMTMQYTGTDYYVLEVPLRDEVPDGRKSSD